MTKKNAIRVRNLGKKYRLGGVEQHYNLREMITHSLKTPSRILHPSPPAEEFWALKDVSFEVEAGEAVGIIGRNGAGKSTLFKILSRITSPTTGMVELYGRVGSLLEIGTGFHPDMTGRENIYLNGSILGMKKSEIEQKFDEIVNFSEIEKFIDTPVKRYSSGMYVRLAFSVAAHLEPEILLIDEVLAVGDALFQKKCLDKMSDVAKEGRTIVFISHNMAAIKYLCDTCILINDGSIQQKGDSGKVIEFYMENVKGTTVVADSIYSIDPNKSAQITRIQLVNKNGNTTSTFNILDPFEIRFEYEITEYYSQLYMVCELRTIEGIDVLMTIDSDWDNFHNQKMNDHFPKDPGKYQATIKFPAPFLDTGIYEFDISLRNDLFRIDEKKEIQFEILDQGSFVSYVRKRGRGEIICIPMEWEVNKISGS
jgi:lipopolysaccharide transport system ATP-binding protein